MDLNALRRLVGASTRTRMNLALRPELTLRPAMEISIAGVPLSSVTTLQEAR